MNVRFFATVAGFFAATMATAMPWHMILFHDKYVELGAFTRGEPVMAFGMTAILIQAVVYATLLPVWLRDRDGGTVANTVKFSLLFGLVVYSVMVFATAAKFTIEPAAEFIAYGTAFQLLQFLVVGLVVGLIQRRWQQA